MKTRNGEDVKVYQIIHFIAFVILFIEIGFVAGIITGKTTFYKRGQIDAMNGILKYERQVSNDTIIEVDTTFVRLNQ